VVGNSYCRFCDWSLAIMNYFERERQTDEKRELSRNRERNIACVVHVTSIKETWFKTTNAIKISCPYFFFLRHVMKISIAVRYYCH